MISAERCSVDGHCMGNFWKKKDAFSCNLVQFQSLFNGLDCHWNCRMPRIRGNLMGLQQYMFPKNKILHGQLLDAQCVHRVDDIFTFGQVADIKSTCPFGQVVCRICYFQLALTMVWLAPGNRTSANVEPCDCVENWQASMLRCLPSLNTIAPF